MPGSKYFEYIWSQLLDVWKWYKKFMEFYNQCHVIILDRWSICNILVNENFKPGIDFTSVRVSLSILLQKKSFHACWVFIKNPYYMKFLKLFWLHVACLIFQWKFCCIYARNYGGVVGNLIIGLWKNNFSALFWQVALVSFVDRSL